MLVSSSSSSAIHSAVHSSSSTNSARDRDVRQAMGPSGAAAARGARGVVGPEGRRQRIKENNTRKETFSFGFESPADDNASAQEREPLLKERATSANGAISSTGASMREGYSAIGAAPGYRPLVGSVQSYTAQAGGGVGSLTTRLAAERAATEAEEVVAGGRAAAKQAAGAAAVEAVEGQLAASGAARPSRKMVDTSAIMSAVNTNDTFLVKQWISTIGPERAQAQINGTPALLNRAVHNGRDEMVQILLEARADPDAYAKAYMNVEPMRGTPRAGETWPLRHAVQSGFQGIVKMLLDHGAQLDHGWKHAMSAYLQHGGTFTGQDDQAQSLLCTASLKGFVTIVELLLDRHADVDGGPCEPGVYPSSLTPLMHAA